MEKAFSIKLDGELLEKFEAMEGTARERVEFLLSNQSDEKDHMYETLIVKKGGMNTGDYVAELLRCFKQFGGFVVIPPNIDTRDKAAEYLKIEKFSKEDTLFNMGEIRTMRFYKRKV